MKENTIRNILYELSTKLVENEVSRENIVRNLILRIKPTDIYESELEFMTTDWYYAVKHLIEDGDKTTIIEIKYFIDCYLNRRQYSLEDKSQLVREWVKTNHDAGKDHNSKLLVPKK